MTQLAILIPTLARPDKLADLLAGINENTLAPHWTYFIAEQADTPTIEAVQKLSGDFSLILGDYGSCAKAMNAGFEQSHQPYVFLGNDDLEFTERSWDQPALAALAQPGMGVCGVNDGHGRMTCFAMVKRSFIERHSGVYDKPSTLFHPYESQYVDTELADYARARGVWTEAPESVVMHRHHDFGEADPNHPNYQKARATLPRDYATYVERKRAWEASLS